MSRLELRGGMRKAAAVATTAGGVVEGFRDNGFRALRMVLSDPSSIPALFKTHTVDTITGWTQTPPDLVGQFGPMVPAEHVISQLPVHTPAEILAGLAVPGAEVVGALGLLAIV
ncbi:MAG TPA: hypothetical protein VN711_04705, partial [Candidatus Saccharimonadales bacterium]|nr:hypothetical protein [Candidatus Saccharimonadales bacterium]